MKFHTIFLLLLLPTLLFGRSKNDINIAGHVVDKATGEHIPFASLYIEENASGVNSDASGHYILTNVPEGKINVRASFVGYKTTTQSITTRKEQTYVLNFELEEEPLTMEEVVVTGNRYATRKRETNTIVGVLPPKLFECVAATNPAQILDFQPGLRVVYDCGNCGVPQLRINGLSGQYSQLLLDSRAIFSSLGMVYGLEQLPTSMIERVEVIRGGGSALYGSNAIGGTVNIITKEPTSSLFQVSNQTGVIGNSATDINTTINGAIVSSDLRSGAYLFGSMRQRESYDHNGDNFTDLPELKDQTLGFRAYHKIRDHSKITLEYHHIHENRRGGDSLNLPPHQANIAEMLEHNINGGSISYDYSPRGSKNSFNLYTSGQLIDRNSYFGTHQNLNAYGKTKDITANFGAQWIHRFDQLWFLPSTLTAGVDYAYNNLRDEMLGYNRTLDQTTHLTGTYLQNEWSNKTVGILIGGRLDYHNQIKKPIFSPRLSLRYAPTQSITLRTSYAQGYRAPQIYDEDLHVAAVGGEVALIEVAPNLREERSHTINLSADYWKTIGHWKLNLLAEGFYTDLNDVFSLVEKGHDQQGNLLLERTNASGAFVTGVNLEARLIHGNNWNLQGGFTYQKSRYKEDFSWSKEPTVQAQRRMFRSPDTYGYMTIEYLPIKPLSISLNGTYTGSMLIQHYAGSIPVDREETSPSFFDLGARIAYDFSLSSQNKLQLFVAAKNLFNQFQKDLDWGADKDSKYFYGPAAPRSFYAGVKYSF